MQKSVQQLSLRLEIPETTLRRVFTNAITLPDYHQWLDHIATGTGQSKNYVLETMASIWVNHCLNSTIAQEFACQVTDKLPRS
jgi:hypothetical protein